MKKFLFTMVALLTMAVSAKAMSYEQARQQALFLADKMAYELNLTEEQYEACYEVNLDYLMGITNQYDLYGDYWTRRNLDLSYILFDWQYRMFVDAAYFYRPLYWADGFWHFGIYARYPHRDYFYFGHPHFYIVYRGGHSWHHNGGHSWYHGRDWGHNRTEHHQGNHRGMRNSFDNGDYGRGGNHGNSGNHGSHGNMDRGGNNNNHGTGNRGGNHNGVNRDNNRGQQPSSTRSTAANRGNIGNAASNGGTRMGGSRNSTFSGNGSTEPSVRPSGSSARQRQSTRTDSPQIQRSASSVQRSSAAAGAQIQRSSAASIQRSSGASMQRSSSSGSSMRSSGSMGGGSRGGSMSGGSRGGNGGGSHGGGHMGGGRR